MIDEEVVPPADINSMNVAQDPTELPDLSGFASEPSSGAWPDGWYKALILEGYATRNGTQWLTEDTPSKDGQSRNCRVCFQVTNAAGESRNTFASFNYRLDDFTPERLSLIKQGRDNFKSQKGAWPGEAKDLQRSSLAIASLGQFERALGFRLKRTEAGTLNPSIFVKQQVDVRLSTNEEGFNVVREYARLGERSSGKQKKSA